MPVETVIHESLAYGAEAGWDQRKQTELAACVVRRVRPDWSAAQALSAVDWVRSLAASEHGS
jgi:hypothetical protein